MSRVGQSYPGEKLTEDCLVSAATTYTRGELPLVQRVLVLADPERGQLEQIGFIQRSVLHPLGTVTLVYTYLLEFFASRASFLLRFVCFSAKKVKSCLIDMIFLTDHSKFSFPNAGCAALLLVVQHRDPDQAVHFTFFLHLLWLHVCLHDGNAEERQRFQAF